MQTAEQQSLSRERSNGLSLGGLELPESDIDGDTTLTLGLELVHHPCILEGALDISQSTFAMARII